MIQISYASMVVCISIIWCLIRVIFAIKNNHVNWKREIQLLLVYICIVVIARFTFFPFSKVNGKIQPLIFESAKAFPFRINWIPLVHLFEYPAMRDILINVIGNTLMFVSVGIVYPIVYKKLDTHTKVIAAGICFPLVIEIMQLPFYDRVSDIDDLLLNSLGYILGYFLYLGLKGIKNRRGEPYYGK